MSRLVKGHCYLIEIPAQILFHAKNVTDLTLTDVIFSSGFVNTNGRLSVSTLNYGMTNDFITHSRQLNFLIKNSLLLNQLTLHTHEWDYRPAHAVNYKWHFIDGLAPDNTQFSQICLYDNFKFVLFVANYLIINSCVCRGKLKIVDIFPEVRQVSYECLKCERFYTEYIVDND